MRDSERDEGDTGRGCENRRASDDCGSLRTLRQVERDPMEVLDFVI